MVSWRPGNKEEESHNWLGGPYELFRMYSNGSAKLRDLQGKELPERINMGKLRLYHTRHQIQALANQECNNGQEGSHLEKQEVAGEPGGTRARVCQEEELKEGQEGSHLEKQEVAGEPGGTRTKEYQENELKESQEGSLEKQEVARKPGGIRARGHQERKERGDQEKHVREPIITRAQQKRNLARHTQGIFLTEADVEKTDLNRERKIRKEGRRLTFKSHASSTILIIILVILGFWARTSMANNEQNKHCATSSNKVSFGNYLGCLCSLSSALSSPVSSSVSFATAASSLAREMDSSAIPRATKIKVIELEDEEQEMFISTGLIGLYKILQVPVDEDMAKEAVMNYDKDNHCTKIKGIKVTADKETLSQQLGLSAETRGQAWTSEMVAKYLGETEEETTKRKKGAQGVPTHQLQEHAKLMRFVAQAICLKKDDKYLSEQAFLEAARVYEGGQCDWAKILEKAMATQMMAIREKGQKLYTCAPIWQHLYNQAKGKRGEKRSQTGQEETSDQAPKRAKIQKEALSAQGKNPVVQGQKEKAAQMPKETDLSKQGDELSTSSGSTGQRAKAFFAKLKRSGTSQGTGQVQENLKNLVASLIPIQETPSTKITQSPEQNKPEQLLVKEKGEAAEPELMSTWEAQKDKLTKPPATLRIKLLEEGSGLPFERMQTMTLKEEDDDPDVDMEARLRASLIAMNTLSLQMGHLFRRATEGVEDSKLKKDKEDLEVQNKQLNEQIAELKQAHQKERESWEEKRKKWSRNKKKLKKELNQARKDSRENKVAQQEIAKAKDCMEHLNLAVLLKMLEDMRTPPEEGIWMNQEQLQALMEHALEIISQHTQEVLQLLRQKKQSEEPKDKEEDEDDDSEAGDGGKGDDDNDDDDNDAGDMGGEEDKGTAGDTQEKDGGDSEEAPEKPEEKEEKKGPAPSEEKQTSETTDNAEEVRRKAADAWYEKKEWISNLVSKLAEEHKELKRIKRDTRLNQLTSQGGRPERKLAELKILIKDFFKKWPGKCPHNQDKCEIPPHPACIQVLEKPPGVKPTEDMGVGPKRTTFSLDSLALNVELLLGHRPKFACMEDCRQAIHEVKLQAQMRLQELDGEIQATGGSPRRKSGGGLGALSCANHGDSEKLVPGSQRRGSFCGNLCGKIAR